MKLSDIIKRDKRESQADEVQLRVTGVIIGKIARLKGIDLITASEIYNEILSYQHIQDAILEQVDYAYNRVKDNPNG